MASRATELLVSFIEGLPDAPANDLDGALEIARAYREPAPARGRGIEEVLARVSAAAEKGFNTAGPGYLAYIPGGGLFAAALADFLVARRSTATSACGTRRRRSPRSRRTVIRWLCDLFGYPAAARGILTTRRLDGELLGDRRRAARRCSRRTSSRGTLYVSEPAAHSVAKAAVLAGFPARERARRRPTTPDLRLDVRRAASAIAADRAAGLAPFLRRGAAPARRTPAPSTRSTRSPTWPRARGSGSTSTPRTAGFFQLTERGRAALRGIERADSITLDPHKGLFLPYGTGCLLVRDGATLREAHEVAAALPAGPGAGGRTSPNFADSRPSCRATSAACGCGCPLKLHGLDAFRRRARREARPHAPALRRARGDARVSSCRGRRSSPSWRSGTVRARATPRRSTGPSSNGSTHRAGSSCRAPRSRTGSCCAPAS